MSDVPSQPAQRSSDNPSVASAGEPSSPNAGTTYRPLRVWIPAALLPLMLAARVLPGLVEDGPANLWMAKAFGPFLIAAVVLLWWLALSRATWKERLAGFFGVVGLLALASALSHPSVKGPLFIVMTVPVTVAWFAIGTIFLGRRLSFQRTALALVLAAVGAGFSDIVKTDGVWGNFEFGIAWRWTQTPEERFLASREGRANKTPARTTATTANGTPAGAASASTDGTTAEADAAEVARPEWPGFRGPRRDGVHRGVTFSSDWTTTPPEEKWRIQVGPGWSSFAVAGTRLFTQEQRGEREAVVCYDAATGDQLWERAVESRFFESLGGLGPRATPTIDGGHVYALGAEGWLQKLDAATGEPRWTIDLRVAAGREPPMWGFSASPLVVNRADGGVVVVHAGAKGDKGILAFDVADGKLRWSAPAGEHSYGSPQIVALRGVEHLALLSDTGAHLLDPATGKPTFDYAWKHDGYRALQAQVVGDDRLLIPTGMGTGTRLIEIIDAEGKLGARELWTSRAMKSDFNDLVVHKGHAYGFDGAILACLDLTDGSQRWKGGRYGKGQLLLLEDPGLLVVLGEQGQLALVRAAPEKFEELWKTKALEGKTWNHLAISGDRLYIRNAQEAACYRLPRPN